MSKEFQILTWDDLERTRGSKVPGTSTVVFVYNGVPTEIDLCEKNRDAFEAFIAPYQKAGHKPENPAAAEPGRRGYKYRPGAKARNQAMRDWADEQIKADPSLTERYNYITPGGSYYHPAALKEDYAEAQAG